MNIRLVDSEPGSICGRRNACYDCAHRAGVFDSAHSECRHPQRVDLTIEAERRGQENGWFTWPWDFDPVWLRECDGFTLEPEGNND